MARSKKVIVTGLLASVCVFAATPSFAQPRGGGGGPPPTAGAAGGEKKASNDVYKFDDDPLSAGGFGPQDARIIVRPQAARTTLIRPRTSFVPEMLKSVENL